MFIDLSTQYNGSEDDEKEEEEEESILPPEHLCTPDVVRCSLPAAAQCQVKCLVYGWVCDRKKGEKRQLLEAFPGPFSGSSGSACYQESTR